MESDVRKGFLRERGQTNPVGQGGEGPGEVDGGGYRRRQCRRIVRLRYGPSFLWAKAFVGESFAVGGVPWLVAEPGRSPNGTKFVIPGRLALQPREELPRPLPAAARVPEDAKPKGRKTSGRGKGVPRGGFLVGGEVRVLVFGYL